MTHDHDTETLERYRQAVMRLRELLDLLQERVERGNQGYLRLFALLPPETARLKEKDRQGQLAALVLDDAAAFKQLEDLVLGLAFAGREYYREFEALHGIIVSGRTSDDADSA